MLDMTEGKGGGEEEEGEAVIREEEVPKETRKRMKEMKI